MGVRGLTTFISNRSHQYLENYELHNTYLVLDGNNIAFQLYRWHCKCNDCFGGDYDKFSNVIRTFFKLLRDCQITPLIIFDGGYEKRKLQTIYDRMRNKISSTKDLNSATEGSMSVFPLFIKEVFVDVVLELQIDCVRCDFEGDNECACVARNLNCPVLSYDSDFYIFDVLYIPFSTLDMKLNKEKDYNYLKCQVYKVEQFLNSFGGLDKVNLPILSILLGNDYISKGIFSVFYQHLKIKKGGSNQSDQQRRIKTVISWLKNEKSETVIYKILNRFKLECRKQVAEKIQTIIEGYQCVDSVLLKYLNISDDIIEKCKHNNEKQSKIEIINNPPLDDTSLNLNDLSINCEINTSLDGVDQILDFEIDFAGELEETDESINQKKSKLFEENYRKCLYPSCFIDMMKNMYYSTPQVENFQSEHSHTISLNILRAIHKILTQPSKKKLICVARNENGNIKKYYLERYKRHLPTLIELEAMDGASCRALMLDVLELSGNFNNSIPDDWYLFIIALKYWIINIKTKVTMPYVYAILICAIILNYVDKKIGFYRSNKAFNNKFSCELIKTDKTTTIEYFNINYNDSVNCMRNLIQYFQMDSKMKNNPKLFDRQLIHELSEFQSCLLHIKYLNSLLKFPFPNFMVSNFYDGTFIYNLTSNLKKRANLKGYIQLLIGSAPTVLNTLEIIAEDIQSNVGTFFSSKPPPKKRKKKKNSKQVDEEEPVTIESDDDTILDINNKFYLLALEK